MNGIDTERVILMVDGALEALTLHAEDATANEVFSACLTIGLRGVQGAIALGGDPARIRDSVQQLLLACPDPTIN
jgi:hypothetical protein